MTTQAQPNPTVREAHLRIVRSAGLDRLLRPLHRWVWSDARRRGEKLLKFAQTEADGGRDIARASERTHDPLLRRLYLRHAMDEQRHANLFRTRGRAILRALSDDEQEQAIFDANWLSPGERGLDDLNVAGETESSLLAFLHLSEKAAARRFAVYQEVLALDPTTRDVFTDVLKDEAFHMNYTLAQLKRVEPKKHGVRLWWARLTRLWKGYLRVASAVANVMGGVVLAVQYFLILPIFAWMAKRSAKKELPGWVPSHESAKSLRSQY